jgi:hypothetical protein
MGKKMKKSGEDTRGLKAKAQKNASRQQKDAEMHAQKEAADSAAWKIGSNARRDQKTAAAMEKKAALAARKALKQSLLEQEDEDNANAKKPKGKARKAQRAKSKDHLFFDPRKKAEKERKKKKKAQEKRVKASKPKKKGVVEQAPITPNYNHVRAQEESRGEFNATGIDDALGALSLAAGASGEPDAHPERRRKAAFKAFEARRIPEIRAENPGLRLQQVKQLVFKEFQRSPENPMNQQ